jgi:CBS-domain-containing membrane protein
MGPSARRWVFIGGFTVALLVGLPVAHSLVGDIGAILLGTFALGFVVGRMTLKR